VSSSGENWVWTCAGTGGGATAACTAPKGRSCGLSGSQLFATPGTYAFTVPYFTSLSVRVNGAGGGACSLQPFGVLGWSVSGSAGTASSFGGLLVGNGGGGGVGWLGTGGTNPGLNCLADGAPGSAGGGAVNVAGGGSAGGSNFHPSYITGFLPGSGGKGGMASTRFSGQSLPANSVITVTVGAGGARGVASPTTNPPAAPGRNGSVSISWRDVCP
jgi:hypothetical protein